MLHGKEMAVVVMYDMYLEVAEVKINNDSKLDEPMEFWWFREKLANSMLRYKPSARKYPGDEGMRPSTQQSLKQRAASKRKGTGRPRKDSERVEVMKESLVTVGDLKKATRGNKAQICGDLSRLKKHLDSVETGRKMVRCVCFVGRLRILFVSCVATNPCIFFLRKGSAPERTASWITTMSFFLPSFG